MTDAAEPSHRSGRFSGLFGWVSAAVLLVGSITATSSGATDAASAVRQIDLPSEGPLGAVTVIGDSVLLGSGLNSPTLPDRLSAHGWGPIRFRAIGSASSGLFGVPDEFRATFWIDLWQSQGWDAPHVIVNLGVNDSGLCNASVACARSSIMHVVDAIGPGKEIWWPTIVKSEASHHISFNTALRQIDAERSDFHVWDWYTEFVTGGYRSGDQIHLDPAGYRRRSALMAQVFTDDVAQSRQVGTDAAIPAPEAPVSSFVTLPPQRLADTRDDPAARVAAGTRHPIDLGGIVADDATAVALYVTAARPSADGYLAAGPCDSATSGATVNFVAGVPRGAPTITAIGEIRSVCVFASVDTDVVVDLQGVFVGDASGLLMTPLSTPQRLVDTRETGRRSSVVVDVGTGVDAVAVNLGAARAGSVGFLSASSCAEPRATSNVNFAPGPALSASAIVPVDADGTFCVFASAPVDVIVDVTAEFSNDGTLAYQPVPPTRTLDTRSAIGGWLNRLGPGQTVDVGVAPSDAAAVTGTLASVRPEAASFLAASACSENAPTAAVNGLGGSVIANSLTSAIAGGRLCVRSSARGHVVFDTNGWWIPV